MNLITSTLVGGRSIAICVSVCLSVCLLFVCPLAYLINHMSNFYEIFYAICDRDLLLLWRQYDKSCTSGFVDGVMFSHTSENGLQSKTTIDIFLFYIL